jgi:hypothetical protein
VQYGLQPSTTSKVFAQAYRPQTPYNCVAFVVVVAEYTPQDVLTMVGADEGTVEGLDDGNGVGTGVGLKVGSAEGQNVGAGVGFEEG